jgi:hypothetical protein
MYLQRQLTSQVETRLISHYYKILRYWRVLWRKQKLYDRLMAKDGLVSPHSRFTPHTADSHPPQRVHTPHSGCKPHTADAHLSGSLRSCISGEFAPHAADSHPTQRIHTPHGRFTPHPEDSHPICNGLLSPGPDRDPRRGELAREGDRAHGGHRRGVPQTRG